VSAAEIPSLADELDVVLAPEGAPSDDDLAAYAYDLDGTDEVAERVARWHAEDAGAADWVARKAQRAARSIDDLQAQRDRLVVQADAWLDRERKRHDATIRWAEGLLQRWLLDEIAADTSKRPKKSRSLPCGVGVKLTGGGQRLVVDDEPALVEWLTSEEPAAVEFVAKYSKTTVKGLVTGDGLAVPGVHIEDTPPSFRCDLGGAS